MCKDAGIAQGQAAYGLAPGKTDSVWRILVPGGKPDDLTQVMRLKWIAQLIVQIVIALLVLLAIAEAASSIAERVWPSWRFATS